MNDNHKKFLGKKLKEMRINLGLTQTQIGKELFISRSCWSNYETGRRLPTIEMLQRISSRFQIDMDCLLNLSCDSAFSSILNDVHVEDYMLHDRYLDLSPLLSNDKVFLLELYQYLCFKAKYTKQINAQERLKANE